MFRELDHVAMSVKDMEGAIAFYREVVGMEVVFDREFDVGMAQILGVEEAKVRIVKLTLGGAELELFDYQCPKGREPRPDRQQSDFGLTHIGFLVDDFQATYQRLLDRGVRFLGEPLEIRPGVFVAYFHGAEYEVCEIREVVPQ